MGRTRFDMTGHRLIRMGTPPLVVVDDSPRRKACVRCEEKAPLNLEGLCRQCVLDTREAEDD